jgi:hypothetical protein
MGRGSAFSGLPEIRFSARWKISGFLLLPGVCFEGFTRPEPSLLLPRLFAIAYDLMLMENVQ